jgi:hypothetical protein
MHVRVYDDAITRVELELEDTTEISLPVASEARLRGIVGRNTDGEVVSRWTRPQ